MDGDLHIAGHGSMPPAADRAVEPGAAPGVVAFTHRFFRAFPTVLFRIVAGGAEPAAVIKLGGNDVSLTFPSIKSEFGIDDSSPDGRMLDLVARSLRFVVGLRLGDALPKEVLTGEASWQPSELDREVAYSRLTLQLVTWLAGDENVITNRDELLRLAEDPATKQKVNQAFEEAAARLGVADKNGVIEQIVALSDELAFIEALRSRVRSVGAIASAVDRLRRLYGGYRTVIDVADAVARLIEQARIAFEGRLQEIDGQTAEIMGALRNLRNQVDFIRVGRDDLYCRLVAWRDLFEDWDEVIVERSELNEELLRETYRFLAARFLPVDEWTLMTQVQPQRPEAAMLKPAAGMTMVRAEQPLTRIRRW